MDSKYNNLELDLSKYEYVDLLNLFNLDYNFNVDDLKIAKRQVLLTHPDKSGLDKQFFLFFANAYKIIYQVYNFRLKTQDTSDRDLSKENVDYIANIEENPTKKSREDVTIWLNTVCNNQFTLQEIEDGVAYET